ncbi:MAG: mitochondrial F1F0 ATP synthase associated 31.2 kDa protein [Monoraphidium minutum]|nr:MAG: mitochondrial F1F0 ATP synthase associated 31.2 kDa protein [Monoraphidium minutum]
MAGLVQQLIGRGLSQGLAWAAAPAACSSSNGIFTALARGFASEAGSFTRKDVIYNLDNTSDPEAEAAIKAFQRQAFQAAAKGAAALAPPAEPELAFTAKVERKYVAAQIVESGIQGVSVPLSYDQDGGGPTALKRYAAQLRAVAREAGFGEPAAELQAKLTEAAAGVSSVKDLLGKIRPYCSPDFHAALLDALAEVEADGGGVPLDGASPAYKKFATKVQALAQQHKLPWQMLLSHQTKLAGADEDGRAALTRDYSAWLSAAAVADAKAEVEDLRADAARLLDAQLSKSADAIRKEQAAAAAAVQRKLESARGAEWAAKYQQDLAFVAWFDGAAAADPANGPRATTSA